MKRIQGYSKKLIGKKCNKYRGIDGIIAKEKTCIKKTDSLNFTIVGV